MIKLRIVNEKFACSSVKCEVGESASPLEQTVQIMFPEDVRKLQTLLSHRHEGWLRDVADGRIHRLMVSHIGTEDYPCARSCF